MTLTGITRELATQMTKFAGPPLAWILDIAEELEQQADTDANPDIAHGLRRAAQHLRDTAFDRWYQPETPA